MFKEYIGKLMVAVGENRTTFILEKSLIIISMGSNDIAGTYYMTPYRMTEYDIEEYVSLLVEAASKFVQVCF